MLLGREQERDEIDRALATARSGSSATLALVGEAGIGKTALLDYAAERAEGMQVLRARGVESEAQIPFASLLELLRPAVPMLERIPHPQAIALEGAFALRPGPAQDRFAVGAATLSLLAAYADQGPVAVLLDDVHWLDESSAQALLFAFRRLVADPIAVLLAARDDEQSVLYDADLPTIRVGGLSNDEAAALLGGLAPALTGRLHVATAGNPLALLELADDAGELAFAPEGAPVLVSARISRAFLRRAQTLDPAARRALVLAATSDTGRPRVGARRPFARVDLAALAAAESAGLITLRAGTVEFRHPSPGRRSTPTRRRRSAATRTGRWRARSLTETSIGAPGTSPSAAIGPDDAASAALEQAGARGATAARTPPRRRRSNAPAGSRSTPSAARACS